MARNYDIERKKQRRKKIAFVGRAYPLLNLAELSEILNCSYSAVQKYVKAAGVRKRRKRGTLQGATRIRSVFNSFTGRYTNYTTIYHNGSERFYHVWRWEHEIGSLPKGYCLECLSDDTTNADPSNWRMVRMVDRMKITDREKQREATQKARVKIKGLWDKKRRWKYELGVDLKSIGYRPRADGYFTNEKKTKRKEKRNAVKD